MNTEPDLKWLIQKYESSTKRYIEAEQELMDIRDMSLWQRLRLNSKIDRFLSSRKKYN